jgi:hypothetical protein
MDDTKLRLRKAAAVGWHQERLSKTVKKVKDET